MRVSLCILVAFALFTVVAPQTASITPSASILLSSSESRSLSSSPSPSLPLSSTPTRSVMYFTSTPTRSTTTGTAGACKSFPINGLTPDQNVTTYGTLQTQEDFYNSACGIYNTRTAWYSVYPLPSANVTASTCGSYTNFDTVLAIFKGSCSNPECVVSNDDYCGQQSQVMWHSDGSPYFIGVSGYNNANGNFQLTVSETGSSDIGCTLSIPIPGPYNPPVIIDGSTVSAPATSLFTCEIIPGTRAIWYTISPTIGTNVSISTCNPTTNFDTVISVLTGSCSDLTCAVANDDFCSDYSVGASTVNFLPTALSYYVAVFGYENSAGYYQLQISQEATGSNCANAIPISQSERSVSGTTANADYLSTSICSNENGRAKWYSFTVSSRSQTISLSTCTGTNFDSFLSVYGGSCGRLFCVDYNDDYCSSQSKVTVSNLVPGTYFVVISGYSGQVGQYTLSIQYN